MTPRQPALRLGFVSAQSSTLQHHRCCLPACSALRAQFGDKAEWIYDDATILDVVMLEGDQLVSRLCAKLIVCTRIELVSTS
jgi:hypothetical protein